MSITAPEKKRVKNSPVDPYKEGMTDDESSEYDRLRGKFKNPSMSPGEARDYATSPSKRLPKIEEGPKTKMQKLYKDQN